MIYIGIDCGEHTGVGVWDATGRTLLDVRTMKLHQALEFVMGWHKDKAVPNGGVCVIFEDARQRRYLPREKSVSEYRGKLMGAGSVKRDATIWQEFLTDHKIPYVAQPPMRGCTKWSEDAFRGVTGWTGRTSNHARDAVMLVYGRR